MKHVGTELFKQSFSFNETFHQKHVTYTLDLPVAYEEIEINFVYVPVQESNQEVVKRAVERETYTNVPYRETSIRNLITLTVKDSYGFRGAAHRYSEQANFTLKETNSSPGFLNRVNNPGRWEFTLSGHGVFSDEVVGYITVKGINEVEVKPYDKKTISAKQKNIHEEQKDLNIKPSQSSSELTAYKAELHTHTFHSDGLQTVSEVSDKAVSEGYTFLALTDHNTSSSFHEADSNKDLTHLSGMELTTFYGHFLVIGAEAATLDNLSWVDIKYEEFPQVMNTLYENGYYTVIAHPRELGNPYSTGSYFAYPLEDYSFISAVEIWNETDPQKVESNTKAYEFWRELLDKGEYVSAAAGRDWHRDYPGEIVPVTYILLPEDLPSEAFERRLMAISALRSGRTYVSLGPTGSFTFNETYTSGDRLDKTSVTKGVITYEWDELDALDTVFLVTDKGVIDQYKVTNKGRCSNKISFDRWDYKYCFIEVRDKNNTLKAVTNPVYFIE